MTDAMNHLTNLLLGPDVADQLKRIADALEGMSPSGSASGALLSEPLAASQGDQLTYGSELALSDQGEAIAEHDRLDAWTEWSGSEECARMLDGYSDDAQLRNWLACQLQDAFEVGFWKGVRIAASTQSAAREAQADCETCGKVPPKEGPCLFLNCPQRKSAEAEQASGSDNEKGEAQPPAQKS